MLGAALVGALGVAAGGASQPKSRHGDAADARLDVQRREVDVGALAQTDPVAARAHRLDARQRHDQVRLRRDRVLRGRRRRPRGDEPGGHRQDAEGQQGRGAAPTSSTRARSRTRSRAAVEKAVPGANDRRRRSRRPTAASRRRCRRTRSPTCSRSTASPRCSRTRSSSRSTTTPTFIGATAVWPSLGGSAERRLERHRRRHRHRHLARASDARRRARLGAPAGGLKGCQFGDGTDVAHLGPAFTCNNKLIGAYAKTATYMANVGADGRASSATTRPTSVLGRATPRVTARTRRRRPPATASPRPMLYGVERGPVCGIAPGAHVIDVPRLPRAGLLRLRLGRRPCSRRSPTAST